MAGTIATQNKSGVSWKKTYIFCSAIHRLLNHIKDNGYSFNFYFICWFTFDSLYCASD